MGTFKEKKVVLGVTGCIAAYKSAEIVRRLVKSGADVKVIMTESATHFVAPLTFRALSGNPVFIDLWQSEEQCKISHISLTGDADAVLIAPASANILAKAASGIADDLLATTILACEKPIIFAPAMNSRMYLNPATRKNLLILKEYGHQVVEPEHGDLACGETGIGRLANLDRILSALADSISKSFDLKGVKILVTAGGTREPIDPIRYIGNKSSGKMGYALAEAALGRGADVILISAPSALPVSGKLQLISVGTCTEMQEAVLEKFEEVDVVIKAAAVSDFRPASTSKEKIKKTDKLTLELVGTPDILAELGKRKKEQILVGFAAESENVIANAKAKLQSKHLDMVVANDISREDIGIGKELNQAAIIDSSGAAEELPVMSKKEIAEKILDRLVALISKKQEST